MNPRDPSIKHGSSNPSENRDHQQVISATMQLALAPLSLQEQLDKALELLLSVPWLSVQARGAVFLLDDDGATLTMQAHRGMPVPQLEACSRVLFNSCLCGQVAASGEPIRVSCVDTPHSMRFVDVTPHGHVILPIKTEDRLLGVLNLYVDEGQEVDKEEFEFLQNIAATLASIVERKHAEVGLRESEARFRGLLESAPDAMVIANQQGAIELVNAQAESLFGYTRDELIGQSIESLLPEANRARHAQFRADFFKHPHTRAMGVGPELYARHKDGHTIPVEIRLSPLETSTGVLVSSAIRDITERKKTEAELIKHRDHLEELVAERTAELESRNKELESFSYTVAHDLRAPLRSVTSFSQLVLEDAEHKLDAQDNDALRRVIAASKHMARLIDDILGLARISRKHMHRSRVNLSKQAQAILDRLRALEPQRQVHLTIQPELWVEGDPRLMTLMLENLLQNAWKYTRPRAEAHIELGVDERSNETLYYVRDDGVGFDTCYAEKLFQPFHRLHSAKEFDGTGVGLAIVQRIIERHGGRIWGESVVDKGASFFFTLPASLQPRSD